MAAASLELATISAVSPSLSEVLRLCSLRAGLGRAKGADQFVLGNPKAWLGTAYHEVLAAAGQQGEAADVATVWERVIDEHHQFLHERSGEMAQCRRGRIVGRPDVLCGDAVIDYKTGDVFEDGENEAVKAIGPGLYLDSHFYPALASFHLFNNCNTWVVDALRAAGLPMQWAITSAEVMEQARRLGRPPAAVGPGRANCSTARREDV